MPQIYHEKLFVSSAEAYAEADQMSGWDNIQVHKLAGVYGAPDQWYITTEDGALCDDGYVRNNLHMMLGG